MNAALILSGGVGARFGAAVPKQYTRIRRKMVIEYVIEAAKEAASIDVVMVAGAPCSQLQALQKKHGFITAPASSSVCAAPAFMTARFTGMLDG